MTDINKKMITKTYIIFTLHLEDVIFLTDSIPKSESVNSHLFLNITHTEIS